MRTLIIWQFVVLALGTAFAWGNFIYELVNWLAKIECKTGCAVGLANPFLTPCFYGALFFTLAFILSWMMMKKMKNEKLRM